MHVTPRGHGDGDCTQQHGHEARNAQEPRKLLLRFLSPTFCNVRRDRQSGAEELIAKLIQDRPALERLAQPNDPQPETFLTEGTAP